MSAVLGKIEDRDLIVEGSRIRITKGRNAEAARRGDRERTGEIAEAHKTPGMRKDRFCGFRMILG